jgi:hypothetical protein
MKCITVCTHARKLATAAIFGSLSCLAGCDSGPSKDAMAPPTNVEGLAKTTDKVEQVKATSAADYNEQMRKKAEEQSKHPFQYPTTKKK